MLKNVKLYWFLIFIPLAILFTFLGKYFDWCNIAATYTFWIGGGAFLLLIIIVFINFFTKKS